MRLRGILALASVCVLTTTACGGDDEGEGSTDPGTGATGGTGVGTTGGTGTGATGSATGGQGATSGGAGAQSGSGAAPSGGGGATGLGGGPAGSLLSWEFATDVDGWATEDVSEYGTPPAAALSPAPTGVWESGGGLGVAVITANLAEVQQGADFGVDLRGATPDLTGRTITARVRATARGDLGGVQITVKDATDWSSGTSFWADLADLDTWTDLTFTPAPSGDFDPSSVNQIAVSIKAGYTGVGAWGHTVLEVDWVRVD